MTEKELLDLQKDIEKVNNAFFAYPEMYERLKRTAWTVACMVTKLNASKKAPNVLTKQVVDNWVDYEFGVVDALTVNPYNMEPVGRRYTTEQVIALCTDAIISAGGEQTDIDAFIKIFNTTRTS